MIRPPHLLQLTQLFHIGFNFITADNIPEPNWRTNRKYPLNKGEFLKLYTDDLSLLGVSFGDTTRYVMLDIDIDSPYHPNNDPQAYARLLLTLEQIELVYPVPIRSSHSGGIHIYYFFPRPVPTFRIAALIRVTLINAKFPIKNGQIEIFPNTKAYSDDKKKPSYYKAHRLPLQPDSGACLLDQWGEELICAANLTDEGKLGMFLAQAEKSAAANDLKWIERKFEWAYELFKKYIAKYQHHSSDYSEVAQEWKENLELTIDIGWTDYHQTNELLPLFVCYGIVFEGLEDKQELFNWVHQKIIATRGYQEYCRHQHEIERKITDWVNSTIDNQYYIKYCGFPPRCGITPHQLVARLNPNKAQINLHNQNLVERTKQRLNDILAALEELPQQIGERLLVIQAKCRELFGEGISRNTLYKNDYKEIWAGSKQGEILENPTPPATMTQPVVLTESRPISDELEPEIENQQTQSVIELSHTPSLYEAFITEILPPSDLSLAPVSEVPVFLDSSTFSHLSHENLSISLSRSESELDSIQPELELKSELEQPFVDTTRGLRSEPLETVLTTRTHRSVVEIARDVRSNIAAVDDELLLEFLHHPQSEAIELTIELADKLVAARTADLVRAVVADLAQSQKIDLWRVLGVEERAAVEALMAPSASASPAQAIPQSGGFCEGRRSANANDKQESPIKGAIVRTLTGLIGVVQHVFQSIAKPFVVYHAEINRTICYSIDDLRFES
jgi:hypothetical protein